MQIKQFVFATGLALSLVASAWAAEFYVAPDGKDGNPGTKEKPFATVTAARDAAKSGDIDVSSNLIYQVRNALNFNNDAQNRRASCAVHDNYLALSGAPEKIAAEAGLEAAYRELLK